MGLASIIATNQGRQKTPGRVADFSGVFLVKLFTKYTPLTSQALKIVGSIQSLQNFITVTFFCDSMREYVKPSLRFTQPTLSCQPFEP
jgi:hypothetical protein